MFVIKSRTAERCEKALQACLNGLNICVYPDDLEGS